MNFAKQKGSHYGFVDKITCLQSTHAARQTERQREMMEEINKIYNKIEFRQYGQDSVEKFTFIAVKRFIHIKTCILSRSTTFWKKIMYHSKRVTTHR